MLQFHRAVQDRWQRRAAAGTFKRPFGRQRDLCGSRNRRAILRPRCAVLPLVAFEIEEIRRFHRLVRKAPACGCDGRDATPGRFHPPHPDTQQMLAAVARLSREVRRFDPSTLDECFQSSGHVQYHALYRAA